MPSGAGYSKTPLAKKLTLKDGMRVDFAGMPETVRREIDAFGVHLIEDQGQPDAVHIFEVERDALHARLSAARDRITQNGQIWVSWPKKASKVETDITEDVVRTLCLPMGLVDIKVCAVDEVWSGLKLVIRKELRGG